MLICLLAAYNFIAISREDTLARLNDVSQCKQTSHPKSFTKTAMLCNACKSLFGLQKWPEVRQNWFARYFARSSLCTHCAVWVCQDLNSWKQQTKHTAGQLELILYIIIYDKIYIYIYYNDITYNYIFNTQLNSCSFYPDWFSWVMATVCLLFLEKELCSNTRAWMQQCRVRMYSTRALTETLGMA